MDNRFKPIGGMFQGVRGATDKGGAPKYAANLVKLDADGVIDESCLPEGVREVAGVAEALQEEIEARENGDLNLATELANYSAAANARMGRIEEDVAGVAHDLECLSAKQIEDIAAVEAEISAIDSRVETVETKIAEHTGDIASLGTRMLAVESEITDLSAAVGSVTSRVSGVETDISTLQTNLVQLSTTVSQISESIASWAGQLVDLTTDMADLKSESDAFQAETLQKFSGVQTQLHDLSTKVDEIYDRLVPNDGL